MMNQAEENAENCPLKVRPFSLHVKSFIFIPTNPIKESTRLFIYIDESYYRVLIYFKINFKNKEQKTTPDFFKGDHIFIYSLYIAYI